jgi:hypothetical protein
MRCPTCGDAIYIGKTVKVGQMITCDSCEEILQIASLQPVRLQIYDITLDLDQDPEEELVSVSSKSVVVKKEKKTAKFSPEGVAIQPELEEESEEKKLEKKKRKPIQRQKVEFFDD